METPNGQWTVEVSGAGGAKPSDFEETSIGPLDGKEEETGKGSLEGS